MSKRGEEKNKKMSGVKDFSLERSLPFAEQVRTLKRCQPSAIPHRVLERVPQKVMKHELLGEGGFGQVFRVTISDPELLGGIPIAAAMKVIRFKPTRDLDRQMEIFEREVLSLGASFIDLFAFTLNASEGVIFMEDVRGVDLMTATTELGRRADFEQALSVFAYLLILSWLNFSRLGLFHGDIKPENVIWLINDPLPTYRLIDWGLTCVMDQSRRPEFSSGIIPLCSEQSLRGTPGFMSPWYWKTRVLLEKLSNFVQAYDPKFFLLNEAECRGLQAKGDQNVPHPEQEAILANAFQRVSDPEERAAMITQKTQELNELWAISATVYTYITGQVAYPHDTQIFDIKNPRLESFSDYTSTDELQFNMIRRFDQAPDVRVSREHKMILAQLIATGLAPPSGYPCESLTRVLNELFSWTQSDPFLRPIVQRQIDQLRCQH